MNGSRICGCCEGVQAQTPVISNRPGLSQVAYRAGTWAQFKSTMLDSLSTWPSLIRLKTRSDDDFTVALLDSFAVVCDILTFYSERSANEHYLGTATDITSMQQLAKLVGYKPAPGVAASTVLAVTIQSPPPALPGPPRQTPVPQLVPSVIPVAAGLQAQSVPDPGQQPITFETVEDIEARRSWNALTPRITRPLAADASNATPGYLRLRGLIGSISPGDWLLVVVNQGGQVLATGANRVASVTLDNTTQTTVVKFDGSGSSPVTASDSDASPPALSGILGDHAIRDSIKGFLWSDQTQLVASAAKLQWPIQQLEDNINTLNSLAAGGSSPAVQVFKLGVRAALFGHNAPLYQALPNYRPLGPGDLQTVLRDWDSMPATISTDHWGSWEFQQRLSLDQLYPALVKGSWVVVQAPSSHRLILQISDAVALSRIGFMLSGKVTQLNLVAIDGTIPAELGSFPIRTTTILGSTDEYVVAEEPFPPSICGSCITLGSAQLGLKIGQKIIVTGSADDQSARVVSEVRTIAALALVDGYTRISLDRGLLQKYAPPSVTLNANVAAATHGETRSEILGSGDGGASYQQFVLRQTPLTFVSARTPNGIASTLQVRVNGVLWNETPWFAGRGPAEPVYTTQIDPQGNTVIEFGDGAENGARLPTGQNNVTAKYRQGIGSAGNLRAGQITTLLTRPAGVQAVINPIAASGGGDPESIDLARRNVPVTTRALDRIVSLEDVGDFARASASIAKAESVWAWDGRRRVACVTVAGPAGAAIDPCTDPFMNLVKAMQAASDGSFSIVLCSYVQRTFTVGATLTVDPTLDAGAVVSAAKAALSAAFGFDARKLMQPVYRSEVFAVLQAVPGVIALTVYSFRYCDVLMDESQIDGVSSEPKPLIAQPPVLLNGALVGAELLTIEAGLLPGVVSA